MKQKHYLRLTLEDRCQIWASLENRLSLRQIARNLGRSASSISREIKRNGHWENRYSPRIAQKEAEKRRRHCHRSLKIKAEAEGAVIHLLFEKWSPEQISGRLKVEGIIELSPQTVYNYIAQREPQLKPCLRRYGKRGGGRITQRKSRKVDGRIYIEQRPAEVEKRVVVGHWERDTLYGAKRQQLLVCVERKSRFTKLSKIDELKATKISELSTKLVQSSPLPCKSFTNDNGSEFSDGKNMSIPVFYCRPMKPQQRGTVENTIGLIREFITTKTKLHELNKEDIQNIENIINSRPRKCLGFKTPLEAASHKYVALVY